MEINLLKQVLIDQKASFLSKNYLIDREILESMENIISARQIIVITGIRRSGKSSFLKLIADHLLEQEKIDDQQIFYVNFDDEFFVNFKTDDFAKLLSAFYELGQAKKKKIYCFFDEIQNVEYWEKWINKLYESGEFKIFITGSNSKLLSSEIATSLTGRNYTLEIFPFSFREYLTYYKILPDNQKIEHLTTKEKSFYKKKFDNYLISGGFPEALQSNLDILEENYKNIIHKDVISRFNIKNIQEFRELSYYVMSNIACPMTYRELTKRIEGIDSSMTVKNYLQYLKDAYIYFFVRKLEASVKKQLANPFKIYAIDNGMMRNVAFAVSDNFGKLYENLMHLYLRRQKGLEIFYYKNKYETDFIAKRKNKIEAAIQVCCDLKDSEIEDREKRGLIEALDALNLEEGYIINNYIDKVEKINNKKIIYQPFWQYLLKQN